MQFYARGNTMWTPNYYPIPNPPSLYWRMDSQAEEAYKDDDGKTQYRSIPHEELYDILGAAYEAHIRPQINDYRTAMNYSGDINLVALPQVFSHTGDFLPAPPPYKVDFPEIKSDNQPRFAKSKKSNPDDIVVSPFQRGQLEIIPGPGYVFSTPQGESQRSLSGHICLGTHSPTRVTPVIFRGITFTRLPLAILHMSVMTVTEVPGNNAIDEVGLMNTIIGNCKPTSVVTDCVAAANSGTIDLLTSIAEAPQTLVSAFNGVMTILKLFKDAKARDVRLRDEVKKVKHRWDREISRLENLAQRDNAAVETAKNQQMKDVNKILHAITGVWLTYRLEIYPTSKLVEDLIGHHFDDHLVEFLRFREFDNYTIPYEFSEIPVDFRCFIKRSIVQGKELSAYYSVNVAKTLWELGWLTFVIDRYMAVGDWLVANFNSPMTYVNKEGATFSWNIKASIKINDNTVNIKFKKRSVFSSDSYCPLTFPPSRSTNQSLDHLALLWKLFSKKL